MLLPLGMSQLSKITNSAISGLKSEYKFSADKIIKDNLYPKDENDKIPPHV